MISDRVIFGGGSSTVLLGARAFIPSLEMFCRQSAQRESSYKIQSAKILTTLDLHHDEIEKTLFGERLSMSWLLFMAALNVKELHVRGGAQRCAGGECVP